MKRYLEKAREHMERHLGDVAGDYDSEEALLAALKEEAWTLAHDGALKAGATMAEAHEVADELAAPYA